MKKFASSVVNYLAALTSAALHYFAFRVLTAHQTMYRWSIRINPVKYSLPPPVHSSDTEQRPVLGIEDVLVKVLPESFPRAFPDPGSLSRAYGWYPTPMPPSTPHIPVASGGMAEGRGAGSDAATRPGLVKAMLMITSCDDPSMWYAHLVGHTVPLLGVDTRGQIFWSREPAGFKNIVKMEHAKIVEGT